MTAACRCIPLVVVLLLLPVYLYSVRFVESARKSLPKGEGDAYVLPASVLKITSLEYDGLASDFLFLKALTFYGQTLERTERPRVKEGEWRWIYDTLNVSTDLDPYFFDPYYFGNSVLTWEAHMVKETNILLSKANRYRDWDWMPLFFMGFNEFYFLQDNAKASEYLMEGSKRPDAPPLMATLATRLAYKGNRTENAIVFLREILEKTKDKNTRKELVTRLKTLQAILYLEKGVQTFRERFGKLPADVADMATKGVIAGIPKDPYGGEFYIDKEGSVKTTSDMHYVKNR